MERRSEGKTVVFFDIDGTLLDSSGAGRAAFIETLHRVFCWTDSIDYIQFSGATDLDVLARIFRRNRHTLKQEDIDRFFDELPRALERAVMEHEVEALPGVKQVLYNLGASKGHLVGLITGNIETCARIKLRSAGIDHDFVLGAYGHEHADRNEIARFGLRRAEQFLGVGEGISRVFLVGDSPADVEAAHSIGAVAVGVATGHPGIDELASAGADILLTDMSDTDRVERILA